MRKYCVSLVNATLVVLGNFTLVACNCPIC
ncbi:Uncharacterised protein [Vibrio cholerae]|nr:Uncharacterised protein [Vibrio cholerae]CSI95777.1 Uncharacterised protein [Vibrio cholerae]